MEKPVGLEIPVVFSAIFAVLGLVAFSCCIAAEFNKAQVKDMKVDGTLCTLPRKPAFVLGLAALVSLSIAQILATSLAVAKRLRRSEDTQSAASAAVALLALSWVSFGLASVLLGTGTSMNKGQMYGRGWLDGRCYVVRSGVYISSAALAALSVALLIGFVSPACGLRRRRTGPTELSPPPR
ncbi:unnamed protein product [Spirodela intermedia]|uniref:Uncharacterized protein n=2 Tax=Spirodela intermedia TaxID=51605 RepID=A0A7I8JC74_SPIIN|nr:unnamed protein product [Spirodela intermedia]CAA6667103.1 unnamed protein product [Spirodela intermedia]CAA7403915.1 unnamed protein product [Spirodela intermedia]